MAIEAATVSETRPDTAAFEPEGLALHLVRITQAAAVASLAWVGRGDRKAADGAAVAAMRDALRIVPGRGRVVIGEGEKDAAPMLFRGEEVGNGSGGQFGLAVDPLEGTNFCASGADGAISVAAAAPAGALWGSSAYYLDKFVVGSAAAGVINITDPIEDNLLRVSKAMGKAIDQLVVIVLDKPRHRELIGRVRKAGARVVAIPDGDVVGALRVLVPGGDADVALGIGGAPEGVVTACAVRLLKGEMHARLAPQRPEERARLEIEGVQIDRVMTAADLCASSSCAFVATGVTTGALLAAPNVTPWGWDTHSIVVTPLHGALFVKALVPEVPPRSAPQPRLQSRHPAPTSP